MGDEEELAIQEARTDAEGKSTLGIDENQFILHNQLWTVIRYREIDPGILYLTSIKADLQVGFELQKEPEDAF